MLWGMFRSWTLVILCLVAFIATTTGFRSLVPDRLKNEWYETKKEQADVVLLGSSHVFRQMDPAIFDEVRGVQEGDPRTLNLGTLGMELNEEIYLLKQILNHKPDALRWIIVEAQPFTIDFRNDNDYGNRRVSWHDSGTTWRLAKSGYRSSLLAEERWEITKRHIAHWWYRSLNLGRGPDAVEALGKDRLELFEDQSALGVADDGYVPLEAGTENSRNRKMRQAFLKAPGEMFQGAQSILAGGDGGPPDPELVAVIEEVESLAAEQGVVLVWWLHPNLERYSGWRQMHVSGTIRHLIAFDDPERFPDFYRLPLRYDLYHLNKEGAEILTEELAREFVHQMGEAEAR